MKKLTDTQKKWVMTGSLLSALAFNVSFLGNQTTDYPIYSAELASVGAEQKGGETKATADTKAASLVQADPTVPQLVKGVQFVNGDKADITYIKKDDKTTGAVITWLDPEGKACTKCDLEMVKINLPLKTDNIKALNKAIEDQLFEVRRKEKVAEDKKETAKPAEKAEDKKEQAKVEEKKESDEEAPAEKTKEEKRREKIVADIEKMEAKCKSDLDCKIRGIERIKNSDKDKFAKAEIKAFVMNKIKPELVSMLTMPSITVSGYEDSAMLEQLLDKRRTEQNKAIEMVRDLSRGMVSYDYSIASEISPLATLVARQNAMDAFKFSQEAQKKMEMVRRTNDPRLQQVYMQAANVNQSLAMTAMSDFRGFETNLRSEIRNDVMGWQSDSYITFPTAISIISDVNTKMDQYTTMINNLGQNANNTLNNMNQNRPGPMNVNPTVGNLNQNGQVSVPSNPGVYFGQIGPASQANLNQKAYDWSMRFQRPSN